MNKQIQKIKTDIKEGWYSLKKVVKGERNPSRMKRIKKLIWEIKKIREELIEDKILLFFKLGKELGNEYTQNGNRNERILAHKVYKSFEKTYP